MEILCLRGWVILGKRRGLGRRDLWSLHSSLCISCGEVAARGGEVAARGAQALPSQLLAFLLPRLDPAAPGEWENTVPSGAPGGRSREPGPGGCCQHESGAMSGSGPKRLEGVLKHEEKFARGRGWEVFQVRRTEVARLGPGLTGAG